MNDRVTRDELITMIPDQGSLRDQLVDFMKEQIAEAEERIDVSLKSFDQRVVSLRKECDIEHVKGIIRSKADVVSVAADFENHEFKIGTLDRNLVCIANDFSIF